MYWRQGLDASNRIGETQMNAVLFELEAGKSWELADAFPNLHAEHVLGGIDVIAGAELQMEMMQLILSHVITDVDVHAYDVTAEIPG